MSDLKLFRLQGDKAEEVKGTASDLEKPLQNLIEANLEVLLGVRFLATEYPTGKTHGGRIDTLGLDENACPVILEYKRSLNENVINQGLYYLDWLMDHKAEFWKLSVERFGKAEADGIVWSGPRLICISSDFTKYDEHAVQQINRNIELLRYRKFGPDLLLLELVNSVQTGNGTATKPTGSIPKSAEGKPSEAKESAGSSGQDYAPSLAKASGSVQALVAMVEAYVLMLGDDVQVKPLKQYVAFKRLRNFASLVIKNRETLELNLHLDPATVALDDTWMRDGRLRGHWGTGDLQLFLKNADQFEAAKPLLRRAYDGG